MWALPLYANRLKSLKIGHHDDNEAKRDVTTNVFYLCKIFTELQPHAFENQSFETGWIATVCFGKIKTTLNKMPPHNTIHLSDRCNEVPINGKKIFILLTFLELATA